ncbi:cell wall hydrolase [Sphingomonas sp. S2-65]|uniref:cell wall hydrolase n=1 Tax=Sphingomonas sp. S2-65 TaxID=2903960 RepID=UPI001F2C484A|nr:cell wall hydrolase [Sphingomonas sp. S2-65]UYY57054.1 cell wall hydrolase [Sphingomonas sp. S2-65]
MTDGTVILGSPDGFGRIAGPRARSRAPAIAVLLIALVLGLLATGYGLWRAQQPPARASGGPSAVGDSARRALPREPMPKVEPLALKPVAPDDARSINAAVPFSTAPNPFARAFRFVGENADLARATDCLAAAVLYEAGNDAVGQRAVAQVVLNRLRHPAFPHSVCGVVFQGHERNTGCQFSFTCDGALARRPSPARWASARAIAAGALAGSVYAPVGLATHYHTDWVVPYWSSSLEKIAAVSTHLFFRWSGGWGQPHAFVASYAGAEPVIAKLAALSPAHRPSDALAPEDAAADLAAEAILEIDSAPSIRSFSPIASNPNAFLVTLGPDVSAEDYPRLAGEACGARPRCVFMAWREAAKTPAALPAPTSRLEEMSFHYLRDPAFSGPRMRWDCVRAKRADPAQCLSRQAGAAATASGSATP